MYRAVSTHSAYSILADEVQGLPEARVLEKILDRFFDRAKITGQGCKILIEDRSTNCGLNAAFSRDVLNDAGFDSPGRLIVVQDPTMALRTVASFAKVYEDLSEKVEILSWPVWIPKIEAGSDGRTMKFCLDGMNGDTGVWNMDRFMELIMGEIPRLRDDELGYGPRGKGFIVHIDIPQEVEDAWQRLSEVLHYRR